MIRYGRYLLGLLGAYLISYFVLIKLKFEMNTGMLLSFLGFVALPCGLVTVGSVHWLSLVLKRLKKPVFSLTPFMGFTLFFLATLIPTVVYLKELPRWLEAKTARDLQEFRIKLVGVEIEQGERFLNELKAFLTFYYQKVFYGEEDPQELEPLRDLFIELRAAATEPVLSTAKVLMLTEKMERIRSRFHTAPRP